MLSAAARPRWIAALTPDSDFSRSSSVSSATTYDANIAEVERARLALRERDPDDEADGERREDLRERRARGARRRLLGHRVAQRVGGLHRARRARTSSPPKIAHDAVAADHLLEHVRHRAGARLDVARDAAQAPAEVADDDGDDRQDDERHQREPPVDPQQPAEASSTIVERAADRRRDRARRGRRELVRVERELRLHDAGRRARRSTASAARSSLSTSCAAQVEHDAMAGLRHAVVGHVRADAAQQEHADDRERQPLRCAPDRGSGSSARSG